MSKEERRRSSAESFATGLVWAEKWRRKKEEGLIYIDDSGAHNLKLYMGSKLVFLGLGWTQRRRLK